MSQGVRILATNTKILGDSLVTNFRGRENRVFALADIDTLWVRKGSRALLGAAITAVPAAIYGALLGSFLATDLTAMVSRVGAHKAPFWAAPLAG